MKIRFVLIKNALEAGISSLITRWNLIIGFWLVLIGLSFAARTPHFVKVKENGAKKKFKKGKEMKNFVLKRWEGCENWFIKNNEINLWKEFSFLFYRNSCFVSYFHFASGIFKLIHSRKFRKGIKNSKYQNNKRNFLTLAHSFSLSLSSAHTRF